MADAVSTITILNGPGKLTMKFLNTSDGTGESAVTKVTLSNYTNAATPVAAIPSSMIIEKIIYDIKSTKAVVIKADGTSPITLAILRNFGVLDYTRSGGLNSANTGTGGGNITFTFSAPTSGDSYDITLFMRKS